jgi:hypothetical protein
MRGSRSFVLALAAALLLTASARAEEKEAIGEIELGAASEWAIPSGGSSVGPSIAAEFAAFHDKLEIEIGASPLFTRSETEWNTDLVFKIPMFSRDNAEITVGFGPEWQHRIGGGETSNSAAGEVQLDFQVWRPDRKLGWFVEPSYGYSFAKDHEQSFTLTVGLLIALPQNSN